MLLVAPYDGGEPGPDGAIDAGPDAGGDGGSPDAGSDGGCIISWDGLTLFFELDLAPGRDIYFAVRADAGALFSAPSALASVNSADYEGCPSSSLDGGTLFFASDRSLGPGRRDIWVAERAETTLPFGAASLVANINGADEDYLPAISADGRTLYFTSDRSGGFGSDDFWVAKRGCL